MVSVFIKQHLSIENAIREAIEVLKHIYKDVSAFDCFVACLFVWPDDDAALNWYVWGLWPGVRRVEALYEETESWLPDLSKRVTQASVGAISLQTKKQLRTCVPRPRTWNISGCLTTGIVWRDIKVLHALLGLASCSTTPKRYILLDIGLLVGRDVRIKNICD